MASELWYFLRGDYFMHFPEISKPLAVADKIDGIHSPP
jgi:hypothetical protein